MNERVDKQIEERLKDATDEAVKDKDQVWNQISDELFSVQPQKRKKYGWMIGLSTITVAAFIFIGIYVNNGIDYGQVMFQNIRDIFIEKKEVEMELEGNKEKTNVRLETNDEYRYVIYIDEERYKMVEGEKSDRIELLEALPERYPDVYMEITKKVNTTTDEVIASIKADIHNDPDMEFRREESVTFPIKAEVIQSMGLEYTDENGVTAHHWDTPVHRYYITEEMEGQVFVIKQVYFLEASEGHGARFDYVLESFEVIE